MSPRRACVALAAAALLGGCGTGPGEGAGGAALSVTRDFGDSSMGTRSFPQVAGGETVMRLLQREFEVQTRYGGNFVESINRVKGGSDDGRQVDWFFYVNGIEASEGAAARKLNAGDRVWWDHHSWAAAMRIPAVVGSFPEPFKSGSEGLRRPVRLDCAPDSAAACDAVRYRLTRAGSSAVSKAAIGAPSGIEVLRLVVGPWRHVRRDPTAVLLERGPKFSGVYARPGQDGASIALLDERGRVARELGAGSGLVAATRYEEQQPTWVVTGTDAAGVQAAVRALSASVLRDRFAVALEAGEPVALPVQAP